MDPVKVATLGTHTMVSGADKPAVEAKVAELVSKGGKLVSKIESLGRNWVATLEDRTAVPDVDGCRGGHIYFNMDDASHIPAICEPWMLAFDATIEVHPVMTPEDLKKAGKAIKRVAKKHG